MLILNLLHIMQFLIVAVNIQQFVMGAALYDAPLVDDADLVGILDGREAVGDGYRRAGLHQPLKGILHESFTLGVEGGGGFVEDEDGRIL